MSSAGRNSSPLPNSIVRPCAPCQDAVPTPAPPAPATRIPPARSRRRHVFGTFGGPETVYCRAAERPPSRRPAIGELRQRFQDLVDEHYDALWGYVGYLTGGSRDREDLLHEAFLLAFDRLAAGIEFQGDPGRWLRGVLRNLARAWWRQKRKVPDDLADHLKRLADRADDVPSLAASRELNAALNHCLGTLAPAERRLVAERYEQGLRVTAIAKQLRRNVATVRVQLYRIRQSLKLCVETQLARGGAR